MAKLHSSDFEKLISDIQTRFKAPDLNRLSDDVLFSGYALLFARGCQCVTAILHIAGLAPPRPADATDLRRTIRDVAWTVSAENLAWIYSIHGNVEPLKFLVRLKLLRKTLLKEFSTRTERLVGSRAFLEWDEASWSPKSSKEILRVLQVYETTKISERKWKRTKTSLEKIQSYTDPKKDNTEDLQAEAVANAHKFFRGRENSKFINESEFILLPPLPPELGLQQGASVWDLWWSCEMKFFGEKIKRDTLSLFVGGVDRVSDAADQALQAHYKKLSLRNETETSLEQQRDKSPKRLKARVTKISEEDLAESRERSEDEYRLELIRRYQQDDDAPQQHRRLIEIFEATRGNMTAAAQQLGVSRPVAYKYLKQIAKTLAEADKSTAKKKK